VDATLLATLAGSGGHVATIDIDPEISAQAAANLERAGFPGVRVATGDVGLGVPEDAPYDRAIITIGSLDIPPPYGRRQLIIPLSLAAYVDPGTGVSLGDQGGVSR
jgi:protein-L-isoaspartate(D-aspartate) O-methyltransferase